MNGLLGPKKRPSRGLLSSPSRFPERDYIGGQVASGAAKEIGIAAGTAGTSPLMDLAAMINQLKHVTVRDPDERSGKNWLSQPSRLPAPGEGASPINFHTEQWDDFSEIPGTTDFWAQHLGIPFENTTPEMVGRILGGVFGGGAPLVPGTKAFAGALKRAARMPGGPGKWTRQRGMVGVADIPPFAETWGDEVDASFFKGSSDHLVEGGRTEFLENPTNEEIRSYFSRADMQNGKVRSTKDADGNLYMWNAARGTHRQFHTAIEDYYDKDIDWDQDYWQENTEQLIGEFNSTEQAARYNRNASELPTLKDRIEWIEGRPAREKAYKDLQRNMVSYDDPADRFIEQINEARNKGQSIFVRWSPTSERDLEPGRVSRDFVSGDTHAGLSGIEITPDMDDETIARRISEYGFARMQDPDSVPRIYYGEKVGADSDGHASFIPSGLALEADKDVISSLDRGYAKKKTLSEEIARTRNSLARLAARGDENSIGYDIVRESLEENEKALAELLKRNGGK